MSTSTPNQHGKDNKPPLEENTPPENNAPVKKSSTLSLLAQVSTLSWNLVLPIVGGVLLGTYLDRRYNSDLTWTLSLLVLGVIIALSNLYSLYIEHGHNQLKSEEEKQKTTYDKDA